MSIVLGKNFLKRFFKKGLTSGIKYAIIKPSNEGGMKAMLNWEMNPEAYTEEYEELEKLMKELAEEE